jgi:hypothetical protein
MHGERPPFKQALRVDRGHGPTALPVNSDHLPVLYRQVAELISRHFKALAAAERLNVAGIRERLLGHEIDWSDRGDCLGFAARYGELNYWKVVAALERASPEVSGDVLDIGGGAGSTALAVMVYAAVKGMRITGLRSIDSSYAQGELLASALNAAAGLIDVSKVQVHTATIDEVLVYREPDYRPRFAIASHVVAGNQRVAQALVSGLLAYVMRPGSQVMLLERPHDRSAIDSLKTSLGRVVTPKVPLFVDLVLGEDARRRSGYPLDVWRIGGYNIDWPVNDIQRALTEQYFLGAWEMQSGDALYGLFDQDATLRFLPTAGGNGTERQWRGLAQVQSYWESKVIPQTDLKVDADLIAVEAGYSVTELRAQFRKGQELRNVAGTMTQEFTRASPQGRIKISNAVAQCRLNVDRGL